MPSTRPYPGMGAYVIVLAGTPYAGATTEERARAKARRELKRHAGHWTVVPNQAPAEPACSQPRAAAAALSWDLAVCGPLDGRAS